ncbi:MAG TPA: MmgE/PrpD family protein [Dehalococcoidales bacterium]|nr:MmgE/PrpD family protein [Dehalococcoidales bacterium]
MDAINPFVELFINTRYEDLPEAAVEAAKKEVLDSLATALGGSQKAAIPELVELVREWGGKPQSTIIGWGLKCPAPEAALVNGAMIHALDYDDGHPVAQVHIGCVAVSTAFAAAERQGVVSGRDFIKALALGADFLARLGLASRPHGSLVKSGWHPTPLCGYLGAAATAGIILRLDKPKMLNALGIAYHQCAGNSQAVNDGALTKRLGPGLAARGGITAALMASQGITGAHNILEGQYGFFNQYHGGDYSREILLDGLGERFEGANIGDKPYPNCGFTHAFIDAVFALKSRYGLLPEHVESITARGGASAYELSFPPEVKRSPRNPVDAQFSLPWAIAVAVVSGKVGVDDFTLQAIRRKDYLDIAGKVTGVLAPEMSRHGVGPGEVTFKLKDGREYTEYVEHCLGSIERPMTFNDCADKLRECARSAIRPLSLPTLQSVIDMTRNLEQLPDAAQIIKLTV